MIAMGCPKQTKEMGMKCNLLLRTPKAKTGTKNEVYN